MIQEIVNTLLADLMIKKGYKCTSELSPEEKEDLKNRALAIFKKSIEKE